MKFVCRFSAIGFLSSQLCLFAALSLSAGATVDPEEYFKGENIDKSDYIAWLGATGSKNYERNIFLPAKSSVAGEYKKGAAIFWTIEDEDGVGAPSIRLAIVVQATGWVGFGLSQAGGMLGSDMFLWEAAIPDTLVDAHVMEARAPQVDDCQQDWTLVDVNTYPSTKFIIVEVTRLLDTNDPQDHVIVNDGAQFSAPSRLIAAWGDQEKVGYHGIDNVARYAVKLFAEQDDISGDLQAVEAKLVAKADGSFDVREKDYIIPSDVDTTYHTVCTTYTEIEAAIAESLGPNTTVEEITIIGYIPILAPETQRYVHHFTTSSSPNDDCTGFGSRMYGWAPGNFGFVLPDHVGFPFLGQGGHRSLSTQIHYDNPGLIQNIVDSSGVRVFYTLEPREQEAGWLTLADGALRLTGDSIGSGLKEYGFSCPGSCASRGLLAGESVTVLMEWLHMHETGARMVNEVIRDDQVVHSGYIDIFEFAQSGTHHVQQEPFEVLSGDAFRTTCYYRDGTHFGLSSREEMCIAYLLYYPAKTVPVGPYQDFQWSCVYDFGNEDCKVELTNSSLGDDRELNRAFGQNTCNTGSTSDSGTMVDDVLFLLLTMLTAVAVTVMST